MTPTIRRIRSVTAGVVALAAVAGVVVAAAVADGRVGSESRVNDGGAWLVNRTEGLVGHVNRIVGEVSTDAGPFSGRFDVEQSEAVVVVHTKGAGEAVLLDTNLAEKGARVVVPPQARVLTGPHTVVVADDETGQVWRFTKAQFAATQNVADATPDVQVSPGVVVAVGRTGWMAVADRVVPVVHLISPAGEKRVVQIDRGDSQPVDVTFVGARAVVSFDDGRLATVGDSVEWLDPEHDVHRLQQPGVAADSVLLTTQAAELVEVDLSSGQARAVATLPSVSDIRPIAHDGCAWAVTIDPTPTFYACGRVHPIAGAGSEIRLVLVNGWVWVNDATNGAVWIVREDDLDLEEISDWSAVLNLSEQVDDSDESGGDDEELIRSADAEELTEADGLDDDDRNEPPVAADDIASTRRGRPVVIDVLQNDVDPDNDPLSVEALIDVDASGTVSSGALVSITSNGASIQVIPTEDFVGEIRFGYAIHDGRQGRDDAVVRLTVNELDETTNRPPITADDNATVRAGESVALNVLNNDRDPDGDVLVLGAVEGPLGSVNFTPNGELVFSPDVTSPDGTVELTYTAVDDYAAEATGTARIRVRRADSNQKPEARNDVGQVSVGRPVILNVLDNDVDPDGDPLVAQNLQAIDEGVTTAQLAPDGRFLFRPEAPGTYRFTYTVSDGPEVDTAQIRVDVDAVADNRPPVAVLDDIALAVGERRLVRVLENDSDPDGDVVGIVDWVGVDGLEISEIPGIGFDVLATPSAEPRSMFRYWISDGVAPSVRGNVAVSVLDRPAVDYPPLAVDDRIDVRPGQTSEIRVLRNDYDPEGRLLSIVAPRGELTEGLLRVSPDRQFLLLTVDRDQQFSFQFTYDVEDPAGNRTSAIVEVRIVQADGANRAPTASPDIARTPAGTPVTIPVRLNDFDPDGDPIAVESIAAQPQFGTVRILDDDAIVYVPREGFSGTDSFIYTLVDGYQPPVDQSIDDETRGAGRALGEVFVGVMPAESENRPPTAVDDVGFPEVRLGSEAVFLDVLANDTDPDADPLFATDVTTPAVGSARVAGNGSGVEYTPPSDGASRDVSFTYSIADGRGRTSSAQGLLRLSDEPLPIQPEAVDVTVGPVRAGETIVFDPRSNDIDVDGSAATLEVIPEDDLLMVEPDGRVRVVAPDTTTDLAYRVRDAQGEESSSAFITVLVAENEAPVIEPIEIETPFNQPVVIDLHESVTDPDGDPLVITLGDDRSGGSVSVVGQPADSFLQVEFRPDTDFEGAASFDFTVDDRNGHTVAGAAVINVQPPENRPPELADIVVDAEAGVAAVVRLPESVVDPDPDGAATHTYSISGPSQGNVTLQGPTVGGDVTIRSAVDSGNRTDSFTYTVVDGEFTVSATVTVNLGVATFPAPSLTEDTARTLQGASVGPINLLANDVDNSPSGLAGDGLLVTDVGVSPNGQVALSGSSVTFTPDADFFGTATFTYTVQDGRRSVEGESTGLVSIDVIGRPDTPQPPTVGTVGDQYVVVSWRAPQGDAARAPVTGYVLEYTADNGSSGSIEFSQPTTSHRWEGLTNAVEYCFTVAAVNEAGQGEFSAVAGTAECGIPDIRPEAPSTPQVTFGDTQLTIDWAPPLNRGSAIRNYQVRISGGAQQLSAELGVVTQHVWPNLVNGTEYTFEVRAQNDAIENDGWSEWSPFSAPEHPLTLPDAPGQPSATRGDRQVEVSWSAPYDGGDQISLYQVRSSLSGSWVDVTPQGAANSHTWQNIPNGTDVSFEVRAVNRDTRSTTPGNISPPSPVVTTCSVPDPPAQPTVVRGDTQATVGWAAPNDQGCAITEYRITSSAGGTQTASAGASSHVFTGLTNGTAYTFMVTAINEVVTVDGVAPVASPASPSVTPAGPPFATNVTSATPTGVRQITVTWSAANGNGTPITSYDIQVNGGAWTNVGNVTSVVRTEASNGGTYTYRVRAVNNVGTGLENGASRTATTWTTPGTPNVSTSGGNRQISASWSTPSTGGTSHTAHQAKITTGSCSSSGTTRTNPGSPETFGGLSGSTSYRVCVRYQNAVGWGNWGSSVSSTYSPTVNFFWGPSAQGQPGCSAPTCKYLRATGLYFTPGQSYAVYCQENQNGWANFAGPYFRTANSSGTVNYADVCYFGFTTHSARVTIGGVASNSMPA